jgi:hypothetical protein
MFVLDNVDSISSSNGDSSVATSKADPLLQIQYLPGYEGSGELIKSIGESQHQSGLLITGREKPPEITEIEGEKLPVQSLRLTGLSKTQSLGILQVKGIAQLDHIESHILIDSYAGNP